MKSKMTVVILIMLPNLENFKRLYITKKKIADNLIFDFSTYCY